MNQLNHLLVATSEGGGYCPVQYVGQLINGQEFYFRYRSGWASLGIGHTEDDAICDPLTVGIKHGDGLQGSFDDDAERDAVFGELIMLRLQEQP